MISIIENMGLQWFLFLTTSLLQWHEMLDYYNDYQDYIDAFEPTYLLFIQHNHRIQ